LTYPRPIIQALLLLVVIPAALFDSRQHRVPNWLALSGLLLGIGLNAFLDVETANLWTSLKGLGLAFLVFFRVYLLARHGSGRCEADGGHRASPGRRTGSGFWFSHRYSEAWPP